MNQILQDRVSLVTRASGGIGAGIARILASAGGTVVVAHLPRDDERVKSEALAGEITANGATAVAVPLDVTNPGSIASCIGAVLSRFTRVDILVNNAGLMQTTAGLETSANDFDTRHAVNVKGVWAMSVGCSHHLKTGGHGRIINVSSGAGRRGSADLPAYSASKAALINLTQSLATALAPQGVTVDAVCPGFIWTEMCEGFLRLPRADGPLHVHGEDQLREWAHNEIPMGRPQTAEDVGHAVAFLASAHAANITGQSLNVDGGLMMN